MADSFKHCDNCPSRTYCEKATYCMINTKTPEPQAVSAEPLPVVAWWHTRREFHEYENSAKEGTAGYQVNVFRLDEPPQGPIYVIYTPLVRLSDAQAIIDRLTREVFQLEAQVEIGAKMYGRAADERDALKAAQVAPLVDVEKVMGLADAYADDFARFRVRPTAAREALRAALASQANPAPPADDSRDAARYRWLRSFATPGQRPAKEDMPMGYREIRLRVDTPVYMPSNWSLDVDRLIDAGMKADAALAASTDGLAKGEAS